MNPHTLQFIIFCVFNVLCLAGGYIARRRAWVREERSRPLHFYTVVITWSAVGLLSLWELPQSYANLWLLALEPLLVAVPALVMIPIARALGMRRGHVGLLAVGAGLGNLGFTLGGYLCYTLLINPHLLPHAAGELPSRAVAANAALAYAIAQVTIMANVGVVLMYPLASYFSEASAGERLGPLIFHSLVDVRAMPLYTAIVGATLAYLRVPYPRWINTDHWMDVLFYLGGFGGYFGIGLSMHLGQTLAHLRKHALLAGMKFAFIPLLTIGLLAGANLSPTPPPVLAQHTMLLLAFMPTAIQLVIIANLFHLDVRLASTLWLVNTVLFLLIPLPVILVVLG